MDDLKETKEYWILKEDALDRPVWRSGLGRGYGPVVTKTKELINQLMNILIFSCHLRLGIPVGIYHVSPPEFCMYFSSPP